MAPYLVLYDRDCGFCRWTLGWLLRWDRAGRLVPVAIQSPEGERRLADLADEQRLASWHLIDPDGRRASAGAALPALFAVLPGAAPLGRLAERAPRFAQRAYDWVARHRRGLAWPISGAAVRRADGLIARRAAVRGDDG